MNDLDTYMSKTEPQGKSAKLERFIDDIRTLREHGYSEMQILEYLAQVKNVTVSRPTLSRFVRSKLNKQKSEPGNKPATPTTPAHQTAARSAAKQGVSTPKKFDWQSKIPLEELIGSPETTAKAESPTAPNRFDWTGSDVPDSEIF